MSFFLLPIVGTGTLIDPRTPKYITTLGIPWQMVPMGDTGVVYADATPEQESTITANADARLIPPLDNTINTAGARTQVINALEAMNIPGQWVTIGMDYRTVVRFVVGIAQVIQRTAGLGNELKIPGNLDLTMGQIAQNKRDTLTQACSSLGLSLEGVTDASTVREVLRILGEQFVAGNSISLGPL